MTDRLIGLGWRLIGEMNQGHAVDQRPLGGAQLFLPVY